MCEGGVHRLVISGQTCRKLALEGSEEAIGQFIFQQLNIHDFYNEIELVKEINPCHTLV